MKRPLSLTLRSLCTTDHPHANGETSEPEPESTAHSRRQESSEHEPVHQTSFANSNVEGVLIMQQLLAHPSSFVTCNIFIVPEFPHDDMNKKQILPPSNLQHFYSLGPYHLQPCHHDHMILFHEEDLPFMENKTLYGYPAEQPHTFFLAIQSCSVSTLDVAETVHQDLLLHTDAGGIPSPLDTFNSRNDDSSKMNVPIFPNIFSLQVERNGEISPSIIQASFDFTHVQNKVQTILDRHRRGNAALHPLCTTDWNSPPPPIVVGPNHHHEEDEVDSIISRLMMQQLLEQELQRYQRMDSIIVLLGILTFLVYTIASYSIVCRRQASSTARKIIIHSQDPRVPSPLAYISAVLHTIRKRVPLQSLHVVVVVYTQVQSLGAQGIHSILSILDSFWNLVGSKMMMMMMMITQMQMVMSKTYWESVVNYKRLGSFKQSPSWLFIATEIKHLTHTLYPRVIFTAITALLDSYCTRIAGMVHKYMLAQGKTRLLETIQKPTVFSSWNGKQNPTGLFLATSVERMRNLLHLVFQPNPVLEPFKRYYVSFTRFLWFISRHAVSQASPTHVSEDDSSSCFSTTILFRDDDVYHLRGECSILPIPAWFEFMDDNNDEDHHDFIRCEPVQDEHGVTVDMDTTSDAPSPFSDTNDFEVSMDPRLLDEASTWMSHDDDHASIATPTRTPHGLKSKDQDTHREVSIRCDENRTMIIERNSTLYLSPSGTWRRKSSLSEPNDHSSPRDLESSDDNKAKVSPCSRLEKMWKAKLLEKSTDVGSSKKHVRVMNPPTCTISEDQDSL